MKTAVSIPDTLFERAEELRMQLGLDRSKLYARALEELLAASGDGAEGGDPVTARLDEVFGGVDREVDEYAVVVSSRQLIESGEWSW